MREDRSGLIMVILIMLVLGVCFTGIIIKHKDVLVKEDTEYFYYKEYEWFNLDSAIYKYHKPIIYKGIVINKYTKSHFQGVPGKGGHHVKNYHVVFKFSNRTEDEDRGSSFYDYFNKGDSVQITEKFYPYHELIYKNLR